MAAQGGKIMWRRIFGIGLLAMTVICTGCGNTTSEFQNDLQSDADDPGGKQDGMDKPVGTYELFLQKGDPQPGDFELMVLKTDGSFYRKVIDTYVKDPDCNIGRCLGTATYREEEGNYKFTRSGTSRFIRFYSREGNAMDRYAYKFDTEWSAQLNIRLVGTTRWYETLKTDSLIWCKSAADCSLQGLVEPSCENGWTCDNFNQCNTDCSNVKADHCVNSDGKVTTITCCAEVPDFPNVCDDEINCDCDPDDPGKTRVVTFCDCGAFSCFDGASCNIL
jgi:hypothetical protein